MHKVHVHPKGFALGPPAHPGAGGPRLPGDDATVGALFLATPRYVHESDISLQVDAFPENHSAGSLASWQSSGRGGSISQKPFVSF